MRVLGTEEEEPVTMMIQLIPEPEKRTYELERLYIIGNRKALESYDKLVKVCKCVQSIYSTKIVKILCIFEDQGRKSRNKETQSDQTKVSAQPSPRVPAEDEGDKRKLLDELRHSPQADPGLGSSTWKFFQNMKKHNVGTEINELYQLEQREQFTRPVSYLYRA